MSTRSSTGDRRWLIITKEVPRYLRFLSLRGPRASRKAWLAVAIFERSHRCIQFALPAVGFGVFPQCIATLRAAHASTTGSQPSLGSRGDDLASVRTTRVDKHESFLISEGLVAHEAWEHCLRRGPCRTPTRSKGVSMGGGSGGGGVSGPAARRCPSSL